MVSINDIIQIYKISKEFFPFPIVVMILTVLGSIALIKNRKKVRAFAIRTGEYLHYFAVEKKHQGKGYGGRLLQKILPNIKKLNVDIDNEKAISLYESYGFKIKNKATFLSGEKYIMERA